MPTIITLEVLAGAWSGKEFRYNEHDTLVFWRAADCHIQMPADEMTASRHHFLLDANPPEEVARRRFQEVKLNDSDRIRVGDAILRVRVEVPALCCECEREIANGDREKCVTVSYFAQTARPQRFPTPRCSRFSQCN